MGCPTRGAERRVIREVLSTPHAVHAVPLVEMEELKERELYRLSSQAYAHAVVRVPGTGFKTLWYQPQAPFPVFERSACVD
jgi:hypothetical protein